MPITNSEIAERVAGSTVPRSFLATTRARPDSVALRWKEGDTGRSLTFGDYADQAARVAAGLGQLGVARGTRVVMLLRNCPEFHVADVATLFAGGTPISIYNSSSPDQIEFLAGHSRAEVAIVETGDFLDRFLAARPHLPQLRDVIAVGDTCEGTVPWTELLATDPVDLDSAAAVAQPADLVTVIYTSGTTGDPKGVMLDHANIAWTIESLRIAVRYPTDGFRLVSYLPMAHIAERIVSHYSGITFGYEVTACPDLRELLGALRETRPQLLFGVPRTYERIHSGIRALLAADPAKSAEFDRALEVGLEADRSRLRAVELPADLARRFEEVDRTTLSPVRELLGLDALRIAVSAAAPLPVEILHFFRSLGVPLSELYGLSESSGPATWEPERVQPGTVGPPIPGLELRLADDGEVVIRGGNVFRGYLDDPGRTADALDAEGWLYTGDIGEIGDDGFLRIVDRKKEIIITAGGKNISPANIEASLKAQPLIGQAAVIGDGEPFVVALLVLDPDIAPVWAAQRSLAAATLPELAADPDVLAEVTREVAEVNEEFSHAEQVRKFTVLGDDWLPDSDELTPTMKLKRRGILAKYATEIAALYASK